MPIYHKTAKDYAKENNISESQVIEDIKDGNLNGGIENRHYFVRVLVAQQIETANEEVTMNANQTFRLVFEGGMVLGARQDVVKDALAAKLKVDRGKIDDLFNRRRSVLKHGLPRNEAERIATAFQTIGIMLILEPEEVALPTTSEELTTVKSETPIPQVRKPWPDLIVSLVAGIVLGVCIGYLVFSAHRVAVMSLSPEEQSVVSDLKQQARLLREEITAADKEDAYLKDGLLKNMVQLRLKTLQTTKELISQRIYAYETGTRFSGSLSGIEPDAKLAKGLGAELTQQIAKVKAARDNAKQYQSGLIRTLSLTTAATEAQSLAMLRMRYLSAKYGLPVAISAASLNLDDAGKVPVPEMASTPAPPMESVMPIYDGPFGLKMGLRKSDFKGELKEVAPYKYVTNTLSKKHSSFIKYVVQIGPKSGLCWIKAIGKDIVTNSYGIEVKSAFKTMESKLKKSYGNNKRHDFLQYGSIWDEPKDWMTGLTKGERILAAIWDKQDGSTLKGNLKDVALAAEGMSREEGYLTIDYSFTNKDACKDEMAATEDGAL